jgi:RNase H-fold protein (predicted Holliday junction resolvase)
MNEKEYYFKRDKVEEVVEKIKEEVSDVLEVEAEVVGEKTTTVIVEAELPENYY